MKFAAAGLSCLALLLAACSTTGSDATPLADNLQLVPVSDKADKASGLDQTYLYGTNEGGLKHISCDRTKDCWITGILGKFKKKDESRINSLVIHTGGMAHIAWAGAYQVNGFYTASNGLIRTRDGGALLYGNSVLRSGYGIKVEPVFEKVDAAGQPEWGGAIPAGAIEPWSAFSDAVRTGDGGYLLSGSAHMVNEKGAWYGFLVKIDSAGKVAWAEDVTIGNEPTFINGISQLRNGKILAVGYNAKRQDIVLFRFAPDGKLVDSIQLRNRGREIPVGMISTPDGEDVAVAQTMPNGENAAILLNIDKTGALQTATRYHYIDGFSPDNIVALSARAVCLFGTTASTGNSQSIAVALDAKRTPVSALVMKGDSVFNSAAPFGAGTVLFAGNRKIGTDQRMTPLLTRWTPGLDSNPPLLKNVRRDALEIRGEKRVKTYISPWNKPQWQFLPREALPFRSIYGSAKDGG